MQRLSDVDKCASEACASREWAPGHLDAAHQRGEAISAGLDERHESCVLGVVGNFVLLHSFVWFTDFPFVVVREAQVS